MILQEQLRMRGSGLVPFSPPHLGSPARGYKAKRRGNENLDVTYLVGRVQLSTSFSKIQSSVGDIAAQVMFCAVFHPSVQPCFVGSKFRHKNKHLLATLNLYLFWTSLAHQRGAVPKPFKTNTANLLSPVHALNRVDNPGSLMAQSVALPKDGSIEFFFNLAPLPFVASNTILRQQLCS